MTTMPTWAFAVLSLFDVLCAIVAILGVRKSYRALRQCREAEARLRRGEPSPAWASTLPSGPWGVPREEK